MENTVINTNTLSKLPSLSEAHVEYTKSFSSSAQMVFQSELGISLVERSCSLKNSTKPSYPCCINIGFFIENVMTGQVVYAMSNEFTAHVTQKMLVGVDPEEQKALQLSSIGELGNMISGRATKNISDDNQIMTITPPTVFYSQGSPMSVDFIQIPTIVLILDSTFGCLEVSIGFKQR